MKRTIFWIGLITTVIFGAVPVSAEDLRTLTVSPGATDRLAGVEVRCPTFSWQAVSDAKQYEIVVYEFPQVIDLAGWTLDEAVEVLFVELPAGVVSWTPAFESGLRRGADYVWFVRPVLGDIDIEGARASDWSEPRFFRVVGTAWQEGVATVGGSGGEVPAARSKTASRKTGSGAHGESDDRRTMATRMGEAKAKDISTAIAAIRGEIPDVTGETYGVTGISNSVEGAGFGAVNTAGGADLMLDGSADGETDTAIRQSGIDRYAPSAQVFDITNSGAGSMTLRVDGVNVVTTVTDQDTLGDLGCGNGLLARWNGGSWVCSPDSDTVAALPCTVNQVAKWTGSAWVCAQDDDTVFQIGPGLILEDDRILIDPTMFYASLSILDGPDSVSGYGISVAVGADGLGLISYWDETNDDLKVAHCSNVECATATLTTLDSAGDVGKYSSVAIGTDGLALISYYDGSNQDLKVAHCNNPMCTSATFTTVDSAGITGLNTSMAIGSDGFALIAYRAGTNIKVARCNDILCETANLSSLDDGVLPSVAIGTDGLALISYQGGADDLKVAHCSDLVCSSFTITTLDSVGSVGSHSSLVIGTDGLGFIAYSDQTNYVLKTAHCSNQECTTAYTALHTPEPGLWEGIGPSVGIGPDGLPLIAHCDSPAYALKVTKCPTAWCGGGTTETVFGSDTYSFGNTAMAIGADGLPLIALREFNSDDLRVGHLPYGF